MGEVPMAQNMLRRGESSLSHLHTVECSLLLIPPAQLVAASESVIWYATNNGTV